MTHLQILLATAIIVFVVSLIVCLGLLFALHLTLGKKFDRLLLENHLSLPPTSSPSPYLRSWNRAAIYAGLIAFDRYPTNPKSFYYRRYKKLYGDFYFRQHATNTDIRRSKIFLGVYTPLTILIIIDVWFMMHILHVPFY